MERVIKFRGQRIDNGEWHFGNYVDGIDSTCYIMDFASVESDAFSFHEVRPESVGQFTGLLDKNGKEIFEGDIVFAINGFANEREKAEGIENITFTLPVKMLNGSFCVVDNRGQYGLLNGYTHKERQLEILGNIHNPELLTTK